MDAKMQAKKDMLKMLSKKMKDVMSEGYEKGGLKDKLMKVTVASDSEKGLESGLSKAKELMKKRFGMEEEQESPEMMESEEMPEEMEESEEECEDMEESEEKSPEALRAEIEMLKRKLAKLEE